jgi:hypothetical protein
MASRRFFVHDPYDYDQYYTAAPYHYEPYYQPQSTPIFRRARDVFAGAEPAAAKARSAPRATETQTSFSIPVHGPDSPEREPKAAEATRAGPVAPAMSAEDAAARIQAAARGLLARKSVRAVREVEREAEQVGAKMACEAEALRADPRARVAVWEALMRMLLRLDAVRGARDYRRRVTKRVVTLQDAVDAFETKPAPAIEMAAEESAVAPELPDAPEHSNETESIKTTTHMPTQLEVSEAVAASDGVDAWKMMAALCEQIAQQSAVISALADRVEKLERSVRRISGGEPRS